MVGFCIAAKTFKRPPDFTRGVQTGNGSTRFIRLALSDATERLGLYAESKAAAPAVCGVAIEVPLKDAVAVSLVLYVLSTPLPGAARSTLFSPQHEKLDLASVDVDEATARMLGDV